MNNKLSLIVVVFLLWPGLSAAQQNTTKSDANESSVGVYLETVTHDPNGNLWVGGSVWLLQGLLLRINPAGVKVVTPPKVQTVHRILFTTKTIAWMIADNRVLHKSTDGGRSWREVLRADSNLTDIAFTDKYSGWVVGWGGIIYHTHDGGLLWQKQTSGTGIDLKQVVFVDNDHGWAMGWDMLDPKTHTWPPIFVATADGGQTWNNIGQPALSLHSITFVDAQKGWAIIVDDQHDARLARTDDGGTTWITQSTPTPLDWDSVLFLNDNEGWAVGDGIIHTNDSGQSWRHQQIPRAGLSYERISFAGKSRGAAIHLGAMNTLRAGDIVRTRDGGLHWQVVSNGWVRPTTNRVYREKFPNLARRKH
jgi:photosystem II stability/assembly factor-like uncharacterized protein